ncbi:MAG: hypothetical protein BWY26_01601 [Elusimicrobia bacterium ADurb.Bin231]|nr:MAG: hypothetical protein BWY26_01601 [Elusimicrobia bacterium ADurb.Bin231]
MKKRIIIGVGISVFFIYFVVRNTDCRNIVSIISTGSYWWVMPAIIGYTLSFVFRAFRWKYLFAPVKTFSPKNLFPSLIMGFAANSIFPMRFGEIMRAYIVGKKYGISKSSAFATIVLERIMDGISVILLFLLIMPFLPALPSWTRTLLSIAIIFFIGALISASVMILKKDYVKFLRRIPFIKDTWKEKIVSKASSFIIGLGTIADKKNFSMAIFYSFIVWIFETLNLFFLIKVVGINVSLPVAVFILFVVAIGVSIPAAPSSIGTFEFFLVGGMVFFGIAKEQALAAGLIVHVIGVVYILLLGLYYFLKEGISYKEITAGQ